MVEFVHPLAQFAQGAMGGAQMGLQVEQAQRLRKQQDWENDYRMMTAGLHLASLKGNTPDMQNKLLQQSVAPVWKKWTGQDFPAMDPGDPESVKGIGQLVKDLNAYGEQMAKGKVGHDEVYRLANERISNYHLEMKRQADVSEREKAAIDSAMAPIKGGYEVGQAAAKKAAGDAKTPDEVMKEMFDLNAKVVGMQQLDQDTANLIKMAPEAASSLVGTKLSPEQLGQVKGMATARMQELNRQLPPEKQLKEINEGEFQQLSKAGFKPEEIFRKYFVVPVKR